MADKREKIQAVIDRMKDVVGVTKDVDLADALDISRSQVGVWKIRDRMPLAECVLIGEKFGVSLDWLIRGVGDRSAVSTAKPEPVTGGDFVEVPGWDMPTYLDADVKPYTLRLPREWADSLGIHECGQNVFAARMFGHYMSPIINDGDIVLCDRRPRDVDGVYLVRLGDGIGLRRIQRMVNGDMWLLTDNASFSNEVVAAGSEPMEFIGYCFAHFRYVR